MWMSEQHADQGYRRFWKTMAGMTWKERIKHILFYYGKYAFIAIFLLYMFGDLLWQTVREKPEQLFTGTAINVHVSLDGQKALTEDAFPFVGGVDREKQEIKLLPNKVAPMDLHMISNLQTKLFAGAYDYVLLDQTALNLFAPMNAFPDMRLLLSEEKMEPWKERFAYARIDGEQFPIAINITGTVLAKECTYEGEYMYLAFPVNKDRKSIVTPFFDYLSAELLENAP